MAWYVHCDNRGVTQSSARSRISRRGPPVSDAVARLLKWKMPSAATARWTSVAMALATVEADE